MRSNHGSYIELEGAGLAHAGDSLRTVCPECNGGSSGERSLSITRCDYGLRAKCFRASCSFGQRVMGAGFSDVPASPQAEPTHYTGTFEQLDDVDRQYFAQRFDLWKTDYGYIGYNDQNQYVMPIFNRHGLRSGYVVRQKPWGGPLTAPRRPRNPYNGMARKVRSWPDTPETIMLSVYPQRCDVLAPGTIVLTEDQISAMKAAQAGATGVALLGVGLNLDKVRELQQLRPRRVIVALDPDAGHLSFEMVKKWAAAFPLMRVALLEYDLKDMPRDDVLASLGLND